MPCLRSGLLHPDEAYASLMEDVTDEHPEQHPEHFVAILVECLAVLGGLPDAIEVTFYRLEIIWNSYPNAILYLLIIVKCMYQNTVVLILS